ncbi:CTD kinase subunit gamma CTK3-domain-containing protein [Catenaria anguillulae PL171]|uniref:CTD kinase subunit gamma CTK3-domain-containing protein n=1 Tax=Catenaria anguillulae PL171 TaxID=765915 RepID=A0A1Y2HKK1_9FUNG|nr:CTD kinase subunit gamma CTK3-domain-containing protein [Catenaria anguillulae PL171]
MADFNQPDPFQLRLQFNDILRRLTAAAESLTRAARFAAKWASQADVLYAVLHEQLIAPVATDPTLASNKINLFCLCDHILIATLRNRFTGYRDRLVKDLPAIVASVCSPETNFGPANVPTVKKLLSTWGRKFVFPPDVIGLCESVVAPVADAGASASASAQGSLAASHNSSSASLNSATSASADPAGSAHDPMQLDSADLPSRPGSPNTDGTSHLGEHPPSDSVPAANGPPTVAVRDPAKQDILRRMEEDRERHKRAREESWIRHPDEPMRAQFDEAWDKAMDFGPTDLELISNDTNLWLDICRPTWIYEQPQVGPQVGAAVGNAGGAAMKWSPPS